MQSSSIYITNLVLALALVYQYCAAAKYLRHGAGKILAPDPQQFKAFPT